MPFAYNGSRSSCRSGRQRACQSCRSARREDQYGSVSIGRGDVRECTKYAKYAKYATHLLHAVTDRLQLLRKVVASRLGGVEVALDHHGDAAAHDAFAVLAATAVASAHTRERGRAHKGEKKNKRAGLWFSVGVLAILTGWSACATRPGTERAAGGGRQTKSRPTTHSSS